MYYIVVMVFYDKDIKKEIKKGLLLKEVVTLFTHVFQSLDQTKDLNLFDIKQLKTNSPKEYFRLRKGKYRAVFTIEDQDFYVH
uniref:type II toxin-antitoxin system RelE family toxin n=1 Tax=Oceanispirochaeta sp. TaxID=2035350 RepID=UPI002639B7EB